MSLVQHSTVSNEHHSPLDVVHASHDLMGSIDLDPASNYWANSHVKAGSIFTIENNGYMQQWFGRVFLNPPGGVCDNIGQLRINATKTRKPCTMTGSCGLPPGHTHEGQHSSAKRWWFKLAREWQEGRVRAAIFIGFTVEILQSTQINTPEGLPIPLDFPICFPEKRMRFLKRAGDKLISGDQPTHANVIVYLPPFGGLSCLDFDHIFRKFGRCTWPEEHRERASVSESSTVGQRAPMR